MAFNAKNAGNGGGKERIEQPLIEKGTYPARLVQLLDMGLQAQKAFQGKDKPPIQEITLTYELVDVFMKDADDNDVEDKPRWISETIPFHNLKADKAKSTLRYNAFDPKGEWDGDISKAIGQPINLVIVHNLKDGKTYANVGGLSAMRAKDIEKCPPLQNPTVLFSVDEPDIAVFNKLSKWIQTKIQGNLNYNGSKLQQLLGGQKPEEKAPVKAQEAIDSDSPY